jgi:hypothetical protein
VKRMYVIFVGLAAFSLLQGCADMLNSLREESAAIDRESDADRAWGEPAPASGRERQ